VDRLLGLEHATPYNRKKNVESVWLSFLGHQLLKLAIQKWGKHTGASTCAQRQMLQGLSRARGKPACPGLQFNLSHHGPWVVLVANDADVHIGVDICAVDSLTRSHNLTGCLSERELIRIQNGRSLSSLLACSSSEVTSSSEGTSPLSEAPAFSEGPESS
jgi:hypothetical protein